MDSQAYGSPSAGDAAAARPGKNQKRNKARRSSQFQQTGAQAADPGNASDSATYNASPNNGHTMRPRQPPRHNSNQNNHYANVQHSPRNAPRSYNTTPATPLKEQAYAGPTFASSPDPSSLPIPRFFRLANQTPIAAASPDKSEEESSPPASPTRQVASPTPNPTLDMFFAADRKEKQGLQALAIEDFQQPRDKPSVLSRPRSSESLNWREREPQSSPAAAPRASSPVKAQRARQDINPRQQSAMSSGWRAQVEDRTSSGQIASPPNAPTPKDPKAMADDLKRILKIGGFS